MVRHNLTEWLDFNLKKTSTLLILVAFAITGCDSANSSTGQDTIQPAEGVPQSVITEIQLSDKSAMSLEDCVTKIEDYIQPTDFQEGDQIPADVLIFIDFEDVYMSWEDFEVEPVCGQTNFGVYRTLGSFEAPNNGSKYAIQPDE